MIRELLMEGPNDRLRIAVLGCGFMGITHLSAWKLVKGCDLVAVMDTDMARAKEAATRFRTQSYDSLDEILKRDDIEVIDVCTPTYTHAENAILSMKSGKHVLVEKPMALSLSEADEMIQASKDNHVKFMVAHVVRFFSEYMKAKELVHQGLIGEPVIARAYRAGPIPEWSAWFMERSKSGGVAIDLAIHDVDFLLSCLKDRVTRVYAKVEKLASRNATGDDFALITMKFERGGLALVEASWALPKRYPFTTKLHIDGTKGSIILDNQSPIPVKIATNDKSEEFGPESLPWRPSIQSFALDPYYREIEHFKECVLQDKTPVTTGEVSRMALEVCLAALESSQKNLPVTLPITEG